MTSLLFPLFIVLFSLAAGYAAGIIYRLRTRRVALLDIRKGLQWAALLVINPVAFVGAVWVAPLQDLRIIRLPLVGVFSIVLGGVLAFIYTRITRRDRRQTGSLITVGGMTNIGSIGAIVVYSLLGEAGFSLVPLYKLFEELLYYGVAFPLAKSYSDSVAGKEHRLKAVLKDPFIIVMFSAICLGVVLNLLGFERPLWYTGLNQILIPLASSLLLISIGMAFRFVAMTRHIPAALAVVVIKNALVPLGALLFARLMGLHLLEGGLVLQTVVVLAAMPSGFISLVPPTLYGLDVDLSNTAWFATMISLFWMVPLLRLLLPLLG